MNISELESLLVREQEDLEWSYETGEFYIRSKRWRTCIKVDLNALDKLTEDILLKELVQGKNIVQITRVTGFFSNVGSWNKGKTGELKDRYRVGKLLYESKQPEKTQV